MAIGAMCLRFAFVVALGVAQSTNRLYIVLMFGAIAVEMIVLVSALTILPNMAAVTARYRVRMRRSTTANQRIYSLSGLNAISIAWRHWHRTMRRTDENDIAFGHRFPLTRSNTPRTPRPCFFVPRWMNFPVLGQKSMIPVAHLTIQ